MSARFSRAVMALAVCCFDAGRSEWAAAMRAEYEIAEAEGAGLSFACGCLVAAAREMVTREAGWFTLSSYALALGVMLPMAAMQVGCALFGLPYLYPGPSGLSGALLEARDHEALVRGIYQGAVPSIAMLLLFSATGHVRIAWAMLEGDWSRVRRLGAFAMAASVTLIALMGVLFLDGSQALRQTIVLGIELTTVAMVAQWRPGSAQAQ